MTDSGLITQAPARQRAANGCNPRETAPVIRSWADIRRSAGMSIRDMAEATGINRGTLSKIERGQACPTPSEAHRLLQLLVGRP